MWADCATATPLSVPGLRVMSAPERINALRFWLCDANVEPPAAARLNEALRQIFEAKADHLPSIVWAIMRCGAIARECS